LTIQQKFIWLVLLLHSCKSTNEENLSAVPADYSYQLVKDWPQLPKDYVLGNPTGIGIDTNQNIFVFHRAGRTWPLLGAMPGSYISAKTILSLDRESGKIISSWGDNMFIMPHGLTVDNNNNIWVTDVGLHQVFKFTHEGKLLMTLGIAKEPGKDSIHFNRPTDVAVTNDGSFYVSDGYGNSRIIKFSATGKYLFEWGKKGSKTGEFNIPHGIDLDEKGNVYVADRENNRVQVFDANGKYLTQWNDESIESICAISFEKKNKNFVTVDDSRSWFKTKHNGSDIILFDSSGLQLTRFGRSGSNNGSKSWYHDVVVDDKGGIYAGDILGNTLQKFKKTAYPITGKNSSFHSCLQRL
jgi:peptidylamidoglycolate lyase